MAFQYGGVLYRGNIFGAVCKCGAAYTRYEHDQLVEWHFYGWGQDFEVKSPQRPANYKRA